MSSKYKYLVVEAGLSYVSFAQALTAAKYAQVYEDCHTPQHPIVVVPYSKQLHATLLAQKLSQKQSRAPSPFKQYMQAIGEEIKQEIKQQKLHQTQAQRISKLCAANKNVVSIFSKPKKRKPTATSNSNNVVSLFPSK